jgi:hypothetical protein
MELVGYCGWNTFSEVSVWKWVVYYSYWGHVSSRNVVAISVAATVRWR